MRSISRINRPRIGPSSGYSGLSDCLRKQDRSARGLSLAVKIRRIANSEANFYHARRILIHFFLTQPSFHVASEELRF